MQSGLHGFPSNTPIPNVNRRNAISGVYLANHASLMIPLLRFTKCPFVFIEIMNLIPATDNVDALLKFSIDGGATFLGGGSTYTYVQYGYYSGGGGAGAALGASSQAGSSFSLAGAASSKISNVQSEGGFSATICVQQALQPNQYVPGIRSHSRFAAATSPGWNGLTVEGVYTGGNYPVNAIQIVPSSGSIDFVRWWAWVPEWMIP